MMTTSVINKIGGLVAVTIYVAMVWGCETSRVEQLQKDLNEIKTVLQQAQEQSRKQQTQLEQLKSTVEQLTIRNEMLGARLEELDEWSMRLVEGYGAGIWYMAEYTRPVFVEPVPAASVEKILQALNRRFDKDGLPILRLASVSQDKVTVDIEGEEMLTNRMGSSGAASYLNAVFYSLTSLKSIDCVRFRFKGGDHAVPGEYCK